MTKRKEEDQSDAAREARGEGDRVVLTNDSGNVKRLTNEEWEAQRDMLLADGWKELGAE